MIAAGKRRQFVTLATPGQPQDDGDGGYTQQPVPLNPPAAFVSIEPATAQALARHFASTVVSTATEIVTMPYHPGVTTQTVVTFNGRTLNVLGVANPEERNRETVCACAEVVA